jgi:hypothetical protein
LTELARLAGSALARGPMLMRVKIQQPNDAHSRRNML